MSDEPSYERMHSNDDEKGAARELTRFFTMIRRALLHWPMVLGIIGIGIIGGVAFGFLHKPTYTSETVVVYRQGVKMDEAGGGASLSLPVRLQEMLLSRARLVSVLDELGIYQTEKRKEGEVEAVEAFRKDIAFKARSTDTFSISYKGHDPETAQRVTERLARSLIDENQRIRVEQSKTQSEFLEAQRSESNATLKAKERELARFLAEHPEFALDANAEKQSGASIRGAAQAHKELPRSGDHTLDALERQADRTRALIDGAVAPPPADAPDPSLEQAVTQARTDLGNAQAELSEKKSKFGDSYPDVVAANGRVSDAQGRLQSAEAAVKTARTAAASSFDPVAEKEKLKAQLAKLETEISQRQHALDGDKDKDKDGKDKDKKAAPIDDAANSVVALETEWARLSRDVSEARDQMNELERNYFRAQIEASSSQGGYSDQVVVLDPAYLPSRPNPPGKTLIVIIAFGAAFLIAALIAVIRALLDDHVYGEGDLARVSPVLAVVPRASGRRWLNG